MKLCVCKGGWHLEGACTVEYVDLPWSKLFSARCRARLPPTTLPARHGRCELVRHSDSLAHALEYGMEVVRWYDAFWHEQAGSPTEVTVKAFYDGTVFRTYESVRSKWCPACFPGVEVQGMVVLCPRHTRTG